MATRKRNPDAVAVADAARLSREDWLHAAHAAVVEGGFDAVRVLSLAQTLGVSRGSFYWHFADHAALVQALVQRWVDQETALSAQLRVPSSKDAQADLLHVLDVALAHSGEGLENMRFELALRGLGRRDPAVAEQLLKIDALRLALFEEKFLRLCGDAMQAQELAALFYLAVVGGNQALSRPHNPSQTKAFLRALIGKYLIGSVNTGTDQAA